MLKFPKKYESELSIAKMVYDEIEKTHIGLGKLALFEVLSDIANKCVLVVACAGTGKSRITDMINDNAKRSKLKIDCVTVSGLKKFQKLLSYNEMTITVDDLSKGQTEWSEFATVSVFSSLCYTGSIVKVTANLEIIIHNFKGSTLINIQPLLLRKLVNLQEYETDIRDKTIRYYHLRFPKEENTEKPQLPEKFNWKYLSVFDMPQVHSNKKLYNLAYENFLNEFSRARAKEHLTAYLNASASLNDRAEIIEADLWLVEMLSRNFRIEPEIFVKKELEGTRKLDRNILPLLSAIITYNSPKLIELQYRFGLKRSRLYEILADLTDIALLVKSTGRIIPTKEIKQLIKDIGEK